MVTIFWGNKDQFERIGYCDKDDAMGVMVEFLKEKGIEAPYIRSWTENGITYYDYGDWSRYCYTVPFYLSP